MRLATWNVNSIKARLQTILTVLKEIDCDIVCLQEIKCETDAFPYLEIEDLGFNCAVYGQKSYNGVAILSKYGLQDVDTGLAGDVSDDQARYIEATIDSSNPFRVASIYLPNGNPFPGEKFDYKLNWMRRLVNRTRKHLDEEQQLVLAGDYNVIPQDTDCWDPAAWRDDALAQPESRGLFQQLQWLGMTEAFAVTDGTSHKYTFWDYQRSAFQKDHGIRIDHILLDPQMADRLVEVEIYQKAREMDKPSDHVPVIAEL